MSTAPVILTVSRRFDASPERVFEAWLDPAQAGRFLFATPDGTMTKIEIDARVGGGFEIVENRPAQGEAGHRGRYLEIDRPRRLVFLFAPDPAPEGQWTRVTIEIAPADAGCLLTLTHEMSPEWADYADRTRDGWAMILAGLARTLENGDG